MKTVKLLLVPAITASLVATSCKSKKGTPIQKETGAKEITLPFSSKEYKTNEDFFRARNVGKSPDLATAKKIAMNNAKSELASNIQTTIKKVTDQYTNQRTVGNKQEFENKFEELSREVTNLTIGNIVVKDEKVFKEEDGTYTYWVAIEADKKTIFDNIEQKISNDAKLKLDYDKKKFEEIFNAEMKKLAQEQGGY
ncbi:MAG: hypothetical protein KatS3mg028_0466 [Bacteroidia bacterium]|nr:MAG: hypothetical protein KatS3mg028_0466 [Bacteroidia bacterium]